MKHDVNLDRDEWIAIGWMVALTAVGAVVTGAVELAYTALERRLWRRDSDREPVIYQLHLGEGMVLAAYPADQMFEDDGDGDDSDSEEAPDAE